MKGKWFPFLVVLVSLGLLILLATLQYRWLGKVSDSERVRLTERLSDDTKRFAFEFNNEINLAYTTFQLPANEWNLFASRYDLWRAKTSVPSLIEDIFYLQVDSDEIAKYDLKKRAFEKSEWTAQLNKVRSSISNQALLNHFSEDGNSLIVPIYESRAEFEKLFLEAEKLKPNGLERGELKLPRKSGFLIITLNEDAVQKELLPSLTQKYFQGDSGGHYKILIKDKNGNTIFHSHEEFFETSDAEAKLYSLNPEQVLILGGSIISEDENATIIVGGTKTISKQAKKITTTETVHNEENVAVDLTTDERLRVFEGGRSQIDGIWTLSVQHSAGSLENFIEQTRNLNLAISFGILSLLAIAIGLILISTQRASLLAQRQMDFVSSVSHEFRTPLSVIYSAGENLSDGVVDEQSRVSDYGTLIKREGKKLSGMVEQILEFAGAKASNRKYEFQSVSISQVIEMAISECELVILEKEFEVETDIAEDLPPVFADLKALTQVFQNLIGNSLKYSNGSRKIRVIGKQANANIEISVEDAGFGISKSDLKNIFEPFYRAESVVASQISGNGLGLTLVKQIVEAHGGTIKVESELGVGSKFIVQLPAEI